MLLNPDVDCELRLRSFACRPACQYKEAIGLHLHICAIRRSPLTASIRIQTFNQQ